MSCLAQRLGLGPRINTILKTPFFALSGVLPREEGIRRIRGTIEKTYSDKGKAVLDKEPFGWVKTVATLRKTRHRGVSRVGWMFALAMAADNVIRIPKLLATA